MSMMNRLGDAWRALLGRRSPREFAATDEASALKRRLGSIEMELNEARETAAVQRLRLEQLESVCSADAGNSLEQLFADLAAPVSQLRMQASLMARGREVSGRSVMALASQVAETLENHGLEPIGVTGEELAFDPAICQPLNAGVTFGPGHAVLIKFIGYRYNGRILRRALVDSASHG